MHDERDPVFDQLLHDVVARTVAKLDVHDHDVGSLLGEPGVGILAGHQGCDDEAGTPQGELQVHRYERLVFEQ